MHAILKSPLLLGNDLTAVDAATLSVLANAEAIAINQDADGRQARRVRVAQPAAATPSAAHPGGANAVFARCDATRPTQAWSLSTPAARARTLLYLVPCNVSDDFQRWSFTAPTGLRNAGAAACVDAAAGGDPAAVAPCAAGAASQAFVHDPATGYIRNGPRCLDVYRATGPDVETGGCKVPGAGDNTNQIFDLDAATGLLRSRVAALAGVCLSVTTGPAGAVLSTVDAAGKPWLLGQGGSDVFPLPLTQAPPSNASRAQNRYAFERPGGALPPGQRGTYALSEARGGGAVEVSSGATASGRGRTRSTRSRTRSTRPAGPSCSTSARRSRARPCRSSGPTRRRSTTTTSSAASRGAAPSASTSSRRGCSRRGSRR